jgi:hypothetical protein
LPGTCTDTVSQPGYSHLTPQALAILWPRFREPLGNYSMRDLWSTVEKRAAVAFLARSVLWVENLNRFAVSVV